MNYGNISDMKDIIVNKTCDGKCSSCGECCADILPIDGNEIRIIRDYIRKHNIKECVHLNCFQRGLDMTCPFRDNVNKICKKNRIFLNFIIIYKGGLFQPPDLLKIT